MSLHQREPVHVVYGGAHLFKHDTPQKLGRIALSTLQAYAATPNDLAEALEMSGNNDLISRVYERTERKLETDPVEDFRIDFEDGYGTRADEEEDTHAVSAANELARAFAEETNTPFTGFRIKSFAPATRKRAERTLQFFLSTLLDETKSDIPVPFAVTLPKVSDQSQVADLAERLSTIEADYGVADKTISIELMIETPAAIFDGDSNIVLPKLIRASDGRCSSAHFGAYDYTAGLGIVSSHQSLRHPASAFAKQMMLATLAPLGVRLVDSVTTEIPAPPHRGDDLSDDQKRENRIVVRRAWKTHFDNVLYAMSNGFYQSWDLHPNQLVARFAAVNYFYLKVFKNEAERLRNYFENAEQATLTGTAFDDAASARGVANFFLRGLSCGALSSREIEAATGLKSEQLDSLF